MIETKSLSYALLLLTVLSLVLCNNSIAQAEGDGLAISVPFTNITTERKNFRVPLEVRNHLDRSLTVSFEISPPEMWGYSLIYEIDNFEFTVSEIFLKSNETMVLQLRLEPSEEIREGSHTYTIRAISGNTASNEIQITVNILKPVEEVEIEAASESVTGSPGSTFTYRFDVINTGYTDINFALSATIPSGWTLLGFRPSVFEDRAISELTVEAQSKFIGAAFEVWCPRDVKPGEYIMRIELIGEEIERSFDFTAVVTGTHDIFLETQEDLLSYGVNAGESKQINLVVGNEGTTDLRTVKFFYDVPAGWGAAVVPEIIDTLPVGETAAVALVVNPPSGAIAGDYSVTVRVVAPETDDEIKLRMTVTRPTVWGIVGAAVVVASIFGLMLVFRKYGRP